MSSPEGFAPEAFSLHFAEEVELIVNGNLRGQGFEALSRHYRKLKNEFESLQMVLPVLDEFASDDRAFVQCVTRVVQSGQVIREEAMAVATLTAGKISLLQVIGRRLP